MGSYSALPQSPKLQSSHYKVMPTWEPTPKLNCCITPWKNMYSELVSNSSYVHDVIETSNEILAGLKMTFTFLSRPTYPPVLLFSDKSQTAIFLILLSKNKDLFRKLWLTIFRQMCHKASNLCQTLSKNRIALFLQKMWKKMAIFWRNDLWTR